MNIFILDCGHTALWPGAPCDVCCPPEPGEGPEAVPGARLTSSGWQEDRRA